MHDGSEASIRRTPYARWSRSSPAISHRTPAGETDKHVVAAKYVKAKTATCSGCGSRFRHRDLVEVLESLTYFEGDLLCSECWHGSDAVVL